MRLAAALFLLAAPAAIAGPAETVINGYVAQQNIAHPGQYTFRGYLKCPVPPKFPGCQSNGTQFFVYTGLTWVECQAKLHAAEAAGGGGGLCS